jgi:transposase
MSSDAPSTTAGHHLDVLATLPDDPIILQQMIRELLQAMRSTRRENEHLTHRLDLLLRRLYGPRTERFDPNQPLLIPELLEGAESPVESTATDTAAAEPPPVAPTAKRKQEGHGRRALPKNLRRVPLVHDLTEAERACPSCGQIRAQISTERSEQLDFEPASLYVIEHVRCTYACAHCEGQLVTAGKPAQPIPKGLPGPGLLAQVITDKHADHIPLNREERRFARQGVELKRSTLCDWMGGAAKLLGPLCDLIKSLLLAASTIHTDDTPVKVRDARRKIKATGRLWVYIGDHAQPFNVFDFTMNHKRDGPSHFLRGFAGYLQADAFSGYDGIYAGGQVIEVGCDAHARRKFIEAQKSDPARASIALAFYRELYAIEKEIKAEIAKRQSDVAESERAATRLRFREERAVPVVERFRQWLGSEHATALPKSPLSSAISYLRNHWDALTRYLSSGYLDIDNNEAEQQMKRIATGRKNWPFAGSENGGRIAAVLFSLVSSCQRHGHDPFVYLRDVFKRLPDLPAERWTELLPDRWSPVPVANPTAAASPTEAAPAQN